MCICHKALPLWITITSPTFVCPKSDSKQNPIFCRASLMCWSHSGWNCFAERCKCFILEFAFLIHIRYQRMERFSSNEFPPILFTKEISDSMQNFVFIFESIHCFHREFLKQCLHMCLMIFFAVHHHREEVHVSWQNFAFCILIQYEPCRH